MKNLVDWLTAFGLISTGLHFVGVKVPSFFRVENWGTVDGNARLVLAVLAVVLFAVTARRLHRKTV